MLSLLQVLIIFRESEKKELFFVSIKQARERESITNTKKNKYNTNTNTNKQKIQKIIQKKPNGYFPH